MAEKNSKVARFSKYGRRIVARSSAATGQGQMLHFKSFKLVMLATTAIVSVALTGCATQEMPRSVNVTAEEKPLPVKTEKVTKSVNTENIMKIHTGMASNQILEMFGTPKNVRQSVCGAAVGKPWNCMTWEYGEFPYE